MRALLILVPVLAFSACRPSKVALQVGESMPLEQLGLKVERLDEIDRAGRSGPGSDFVSDLYLARGHLAYRALRIQNTGKEALHFHILLPSTNRPLLELRTRLMGAYRRDEPAVIDVNGPPHMGLPRNAFDYRADFILAGAQLEYGEASEEVPLGLRPEDRPGKGLALLRPGESAVLVYRFRLTEETPLISSICPARPARSAGFCYSSSLPTPYGPRREDWLIGRKARVRTFPDFLILRDGTSARHAYLSADLRAERTVPQYVAHPHSSMAAAANAPDSEVSQRQEGLPELF